MNKNFVILFLSVLTVIGFGWGFFQTAESNESRNTVENDRARAFYDLVDSVEKLSVLSGKSLVTADDAGRVRLYSDMNTEAYIAQENLCQLPVYHNAMLRTEKFLNQMGNFSHSLLTKAVNGESLTTEEQKTLETLNEEVENVSEELHQLASEDENPFSWKAIQAANKKIDDGEIENAGIANASLTEITNGLEEVPSLTYDGPFSDHLESGEPIEISGNESTWEEVLAKAETILGDNYQYEAYGKSSDTAGFAVYTVAVKTSSSETEGEVIGYFDFSRTGGYPVQYTASSQGKEAALAPEECVSKAEDFLNRTEYSELVSNYYLVEGDTITITFISHQQDVIIYPEMVKVTVDMSDGTVVGMDAKSYLKYHKERSFEEQQLTTEEATARLAEGLTPDSITKAVIPLENGEEALCYEFRVSKGNHDYLIYLNAVTGAQEDILMVQSDENGTFTL